MSLYRVDRLFHPVSRRCLDVAVDHGLFGEYGYIRGIERMESVLETLLDAAPDAIQLTAGQADLLQARPGRDKPALVLRSDVANVYGNELPRMLFSRVAEDVVGQAVRLDAACVVVSLFDIPGQPELHAACIANIQHLRGACDQVAMPLMIEPLVMRPAASGEPYGVDGDAARICALVRQATELGADVIKADPTDDLEDYGKVVEVARVPVLVRGGGRVPDADLFARTRTVLDAGAAGIVYGRNIVQHDYPHAVTRALLAILHEDATPDDAAKILAEHAEQA